MGNILLIPTNFSISNVKVVNTQVISYTLNWTNPSDTDYYTNIQFKIDTSETTAIASNSASSPLTSYNVTYSASAAANSIESIQLLTDTNYTFIMRYVYNTTDGFYRYTSNYVVKYAPSVNITKQFTLVDTSTSGRTLYLPLVAQSAGSVFYIKDKTGGAGTRYITIYPNLSDTTAKIDNTTSCAITIGLGYLILSSDGTNWWIFSSSNSYTTFSPYATIPTFSANYINKSMSSDKQVCLVNLTGVDCLLTIPPPSNKIIIIIGTNVTSAYKLYITSQSGLIHGVSYVSLTSDVATNQKNVGLILFGDSTNWHILGGMFTASTNYDDNNNLYSTDLTLTKNNNKQITYFSSNPISYTQSISVLYINLNFQIPNNSATVLFFKNTAALRSDNKYLRVFFQPKSPATFNGKEYYFYQYNTDKSQGGAIIIGINNNGVITYYMIGYQYQI